MGGLTSRQQEIYLWLKVMEIQEAQDHHQKLVINQI